MSDLNLTLAQIREMQGKPPINPHIIEGFGPGNPPSPEPPRAFPSEATDGLPDLPIDDEFLTAGPPEPEPAPSPLIPRRPIAPLPVDRTMSADEISNHFGHTPPPIPTFALAVADRMASWKGRDVQLTESEEKSIRGVVLRAIQRELDADLAAAGARRTRKPRAASQPVPEAPKKRGRPRKVTP